MERTPAILVRKTSFSETTLICTWISERYGKIKTSARGARKTKHPSFPGLDLFHEVEICFQRSLQSDLHSLKEVHVTFPFAPHAHSYSNLTFAAYFGEICDRILSAPDEPAPEVFDLLKRGLRFLRESPASLRALTHFESSLCRAIGAGGDPLEVFEHYCSRVPKTRTIALKTIG